jgi:HEPN domain-containing protein
MKRYTRQWVRKAESDIVVARHLFKLKPVPSDEICFHCQQAIEKYLKSLLDEFGLPIQKTHDLTILLNQLIPADATLRPLGRGLKAVTRYAVEYRYPGVNTNSRQARAAYRKALVVRDEIRRRLGLPPRRLK